MIQIRVCKRCNNINRSSNSQIEKLEISSQISIKGGHASGEWTLKFFKFFWHISLLLFVGNLCPPGSRSGTVFLDTDPTDQNEWKWMRINADPQHWISPISVRYNFRPPWSGLWFSIRNIVVFLWKNSRTFAFRETKKITGKVQQLLFEKGPYPAVTNSDLSDSKCE